MGFLFNEDFHDEDFLKKPEVTLQDIKDILARTGLDIIWDIDKILDVLYDISGKKWTFEGYFKQEDHNFFFISCAPGGIVLEDDPKDLHPALYFMYKERIKKVADPVFTEEEMQDTIRRAGGTNGLAILDSYPLTAAQSQKIRQLLDYQQLKKQIEKTREISSKEASEKIDKMSKTPAFKNVVNKIFGKDDMER